VCTCKLVILPKFNIYDCVLADLLTEIKKKNKDISVLHYFPNSNMVLELRV
jgi:hypothetical protein